MIDRALTTSAHAGRRSTHTTTRTDTRRFTTPLVVGGIVALATVFAGYYAVPIEGWAVMTDELQVVRLAISMTETLSPVPTIHGAYYGAHSQLYPLLLAPLYAVLAAPAAGTAAHALNGLLIAGAAVPAYLLARSVTGSRVAGYVAASLTVFTPWLALSATLLTENAAYPAFVWAVFLCHRSLVEPGPRTDTLALTGLLLAFAARTQLVVLAIALPIALALHELSLALRSDTPTWDALRSAASRHRVLVSAYLAGALVAGVLAVAGALGGVVGNYTLPFEGDLVPDGLWRSAAAHFDQIAVGAGILPALLGGSWVLTTAIRPAGRAAHAFAALLAVLVPTLTLQVTSFDLRFTPEQFIQERYLVYVVPLVAVGAAAWLVQRTELRLRLATLAVSTAVLVGLLALESYDEKVLIYWTSPAAAFYPAVVTAASFVGLSGPVLLQLAAVALSALVALGAWRAPTPLPVLAGVAVSAFGLVQAGYVFERFVAPNAERSAESGPRDWIDRVVPEGASVALVPGGPDGATAWWEAELWNKDVDRVLRVGSGPTFSPFPTERVVVDGERGLLTGARPSDFLVVSRREKRFALRATWIASSRGLTLVRAGDVYRLEWSTRGLTADGWTRPGRVSRLRLHGRPDRSVRRTVVLTLAASRYARAPVPFQLRGGGQEITERVHPGGARPPVGLTMCVPPRGFTDIELRTRGRTRLPDGRVVSVHVESLVVWPAGTCPDGSHRME